MDELSAEIKNHQVFRALGEAVANAQPDDARAPVTPANPAAR